MSKTRRRSLEALTALRRRRSVRGYLPTRLARRTILRIVDAGRRAPSAMNVQPWTFIAVTDPSTRRELARIADYGAFLSDAPACIAVFCRPTRYYLEDGCAATQNILIAATALGVGSCWVAGDKKPYAGRIRRLLKVPKDLRLVSLVALGLPRRRKPPTPKKPLGQLLRWESFG